MMRWKVAAAWEELGDSLTGIGLGRYFPDQILLQTVVILSGGVLGRHQYVLQQSRVEKQQHQADRRSVHDFEAPSPCQQCSVFVIEHILFPLVNSASHDARLWVYSFLSDSLFAPFYLPAVSPRLAIRGRRSLQSRFQYLSLERLAPFHFGYRIRLQRAGWVARWEVKVRWAYSTPNASERYQTRGFSWKKGSLATPLDWVTAH